MTEATITAFSLGFATGAVVMFLVVAVWAWKEMR